jgi:hypothetical protein
MMRRCPYRPLIRRLPAPIRCGDSTLRVVTAHATQCTFYTHVIRRHTPLCGTWLEDQSGNLPLQAPRGRYIGQVDAERLAHDVSTERSGTVTPLVPVVHGPMSRWKGRPRTRRVRIVVPCAEVHRNRQLGAVWHLQVHLPRRKRTQPCSSCGAGVTPGAECHPTRVSGADPSLRCR